MTRPHAGRRAILVLIVGLAGCRAGNEVVAYTSVDQVFSEPVFRECEQQAGFAVRAVFDTEVNRLIAEATSPHADVFWSGDPVRPFLLVKRGLVEPYLSPNAAAIPAAFKAADGTWTGVGARARILLVNTSRVDADSMPRSIVDLANPHWSGDTAIANPRFGTTTMHVAALFAAWGDERARAFLKDLRTNGVRVASSNGEVKRLVAAGEVAFGLTDTDDAHEALAEHAPVTVVYPDQDGLGTLVMPTAVVLLKGGPHPQPGRQLIDCLLRPEVERRLAESAAHMPLRPGLPPPQGVVAIGELHAMPVDYAHLGEIMERIEPWLREWTGV